MEKQTRKTKDYRIERRFSKITVPYKERELVFAYPIFGPDNYYSFSAYIENNGLLRATGEETSLLFLQALKNPDELEFREIMGVDGELTFFTRLLWTKDGVYGYDNRDGKKKNEKYLKDKLSSRESKGVIYSEDGSIRYAPRKTRFFRSGEQKASQLETNSLVRVLANDFGAFNLAKAASKYKSKPLIIIYDKLFHMEICAPWQRIATFKISVEWDPNYASYAEERLEINYTNTDKYNNFCAFGVFPNSDKT